MFVCQPLFYLFSDFRVFWKNTFFSPRHASLPKNNLPPTTIPQQPVGFLIIVYSISNIKQKLFLSCFCCVSFVSSDLYIIAHLEIFVNTFFKLFSFRFYTIKPIFIQFTSIIIWSKLPHNINGILPLLFM